MIASPPPDDYAHSRHAGNAGDVFKHIALAALLRAVPAQLYVETHAGDGIFTMGSVGEWSGGISRLWSVPAEPEGDALDRYFAVVRGFSRPDAERPQRYPGSPLIARALLSAQARMVLYELQPTPAHVLRRALEPREVVEVFEQDGYAALSTTLAQAGSLPAVALIDPPYSQKQEWERVAQALVAARTAAPMAALLLWYPIKALTRPRALLAQLARLGVHGTAIELITTPLRLQRDRLSGSGVVLLNAPLAAAQGLCAVLPRLGPLLATHGEWSATQIGF